MLVRIYKAPQTEDGTRALSIEEVKDQKEWLRLGLLKPVPIYGKKIYNTEWCHVTEAEMELFPYRALRKDDAVREAGFQIVKGEGISKSYVIWRFNTSSERP